MIRLAISCIVLVTALLLASCQSQPSKTELAYISTLCDTTEGCPPGESDRRWRLAEQAQERAKRSLHASAAASEWLACSIHAYPGWHLRVPNRTAQAAALATRCADALLQIETERNANGWATGPMRLAGSPASLEMRGWSSPPAEQVSIATASSVGFDVYGGKRHTSEGFGVPVALVWPRCADHELCKLLPPEGVFRNATAWIEPSGQHIRLVLANSRHTPDHLVGALRLPLARDSSAGYARGVATSKLSRLAFFGLLGGKEIGSRAGVYLLEDYDPGRHPIVMIHGLGSDPLVWARLSNEIWGNPALSDRYQVWHVVYQTNAPLLVTRLRIKGYLDDAWRILDPEADDPARENMVFVGHSLGGVLARLLASDSGDTLWNAAFTVSPEQLAATPEDRQLLRSIFRFEAYPGVSRAVFLAAPHRGAPAAGTWWGRLGRILVGRRAPEVKALRRVAERQPEAVVSGLRETYLQARINSISTLQTFQPVRAASESLLPVSRIRYHSIIGVKAGTDPPGDGFVPVHSAVLAGAASTMYVPGDHSLPLNQSAIEEVLRVLHEPAEQTPPTMR